MKTNKIRLVAMLVLGGLLACGSVAFAQDAAPQAKKGRGRMPTLEQLTTELKLTNKQKPKVDAVLKDTQKKQQELRDDTSLSQEDRRTKQTAIRDDANKKMKEILTPDQFQKYQAMRPTGKKGGNNAPATPAPATATQ